MVSDPVTWLNDDKRRNPYRNAWGNDSNASFALNDTGSRASTQIWLMGDGNLVSYSHMIRAATLRLSSGRQVRMSRVISSPTSMLVVSLMTGCLPGTP